MTERAEELSVDGWIASCASAADDAERDAASIAEPVGQSVVEGHVSGRRLRPPPDQDPTR